MISLVFLAITACATGSASGGEFRFEEGVPYTFELRDKKAIERVLVRRQFALNETAFLELELDDGRIFFLRLDEVRAFGRSPDMSP